MQKFILFYFILCTFVLAQKISIEGTVYDQEDKQSIPGAKVVIVGIAPKITNFNGFFSFEIDSTFYGKEINISFTGYQLKKIKIQKNKNQYLIYLKNDENKVKAVSVQAKRTENPAHRLLKGIIENRAKYHFEDLENYEYQKYYKAAMYGSNIPEKLTKKGILKPFNFIFQQYADTIDGKKYIPLLMVEKISEQRTQREPKKSNEKIVAKRQSVSTEIVDITNYINDLAGNFDYQSDFIRIGGKNFISPFSSFGLQHYYYSLSDSIQEGKDKYFKVDYYPKNQADLTFKGFFWVKDTVFYVQKVSGELSGKSNINYVSYFDFQVNYLNFADTLFAVEKEKMRVFFHPLPEYLAKPSEKSLGVMGEQNTVFSNYRFNSPLFQMPKQQQQEEEEWADTEWKKNRPISLSLSEEKIYQLTDTIQQIPQYKKIKNIFKLLIDGYYPFGPVELGNLWTFYNYNLIEKHRFTLGLRTNRLLHPDVQIQIYGGYGTGDQNWKYGGSLLFFLNKKKWEFFKVNFSSDVEILQDYSPENQSYTNGMSSFFIANDLLGNFIVRPGLRRTTPYIWAQRFSWMYGRDILPGFSATVGFQGAQLSSLGNLYWQKLGNGMAADNLADFSFRLSLNYIHKPVYIQRDYQRILTKKYLYPLVSLDLQVAIPYFLGLYSYQKIKISLEQYFFARAWGESMVQVGIGKIFGAAPYTFSFLHQGSGSYIFQADGFNTMNIGEFISTEYISLKYEHNFNGFFLGKIPGLKRLKWREVVGMRLLTGSMKYLYIIQPETIDFFTFKNYLPLIEFNVGLDNIFQFLRIDAVFRATYLNHPNVEKVGVRASINLSF